MQGEVIFFISHIFNTLYAKRYRRIVFIQSLSNDNTSIILLVGGAAYHKLMTKSIFSPSFVASCPVVFFLLDIISVISMLQKNGLVEI